MQLYVTGGEHGRVVKGRRKGRRRDTVIGGRTERG